MAADSQSSSSSSSSEYELPTKLVALEKLVAGGVAGCMAKTTSAPLDRIKILFQVCSKTKFSLSLAANRMREIVRADGFFALWRGNGAMMVRVVPYAATQFLAFDTFQAAMLSRAWGDEHKVVVRFLAGAAAGATATSLTYPLDLLRARLTLQHGCETTLKYRSISGAIRIIVRDEGFSALYKGITPTLMGVLPMAGSSFCVFETLKHSIARVRHQSPDDISVMTRFCCGAVAGFTAQSLVYPLDVVRRRMQVDEVARYRSVSHAMREILATEGYRGLYKGLAVNWIKGPISTAIAFTVYDAVKLRFRRRFHATETAGVVA